MSYKDSQRFRKVYGYYRPIPKVSVEGLTDVVRDYVDGIISALDWKQSVRVASTANVTLASPGMIDSVSLEDEDRVLLKAQTNSAENGLYIYYAANGLIRSSDALQDILTCGAAVYVDEGTVNAETVWFLKTNNPIVVDTTNLLWKSIKSITSAGADPDAQYLVLSATGSLGSERVFTAAANSGLIAVDNGAGSTFNVSINNSIVATVSGTTFSGVTKHTAGLSGSLTHLTDGTSYLIAGTGVNIVSASNGAITISSTGSSTVAGSNTQVQFNDGGAFGGVGNFTFNKTNNNLFLSGALLIIGDTRSEGTLTSAGNITPDTDKTYNLGSAEKRWANVYTGDLHLKNDRGDYTLIEEEDMLTIRFNKTGKRYKFILERVPELDEDEDEKR